MFRFRKLGLIQMSYLKKDRLLTNVTLDSVMAAEAEEKRLKNNEIILIVLITIFILLFFARTLTVFLVLLVSGLIIGIFGWIKLYKEKREKR